MLATCREILETLQDESQDKALTTLVNLVTEVLWPCINGIKQKVKVLNESASLKGSETGNLNALHDVFVICTSQIKKCLSNLFDIFKTEGQFGIHMKETRECIIERVNWCLNRLEQIITELDLNTPKLIDADNTEILNKSAFISPMYFINWLDHIFDLLTSLTHLTYSNCFDEKQKSFKWDDSLLECVSALHLSIDEMLLSAITLSKYCIGEDQRIIIARSQVVLRETKSLITELLNCDFNEVHKATKELIKSPIKPSNVNVCIGVLKESLYSLESSTNSALLSLLIHTFSTDFEIIHNLILHSVNSCDCEDPDDCNLVKDYDFFNEQVIQITGFAISCTSDHKRMLCLRSCLASVEALDPQLVPSILLAASTCHTKQLVRMWKNEFVDIKNNVLLTVDPGAFIEKARDSLKHLTIKIIEEHESEDQYLKQIVANTKLIVDFFDLYRAHDPEALLKSEHLDASINNLKKALKECEYVFKIMLKGEKCASERVVKRVKLVYTMVNRIHAELSPQNDNFDNSYEREPNETVVKKKADDTNIVKKLQISKTADLTKTIFTKSNNTPTKSVAAKLTERLKIKKMKDDINFSLKLDNIFDNVSQYELVKPLIMTNCLSPIQKSNNTFYKKSNTDSLRKTMLKKFSKVTLRDISIGESSKGLSDTDKSKNVNNSFDLQITEILDQLSEISNVSSVTNKNAKSTLKIECNSTLPSKTNVLRLRINDSTNLQDIWNITVRSSEKTDESDTNNTSGSSSHMEISTNERLKDLNILDEKLRNLRSTDIF